MAMSYEFYQEEARRVIWGRDVYSKKWLHTRRCSALMSREIDVVEYFLSFGARLEFQP